jgi:hypothetical protein
MKKLILIVLFLLPFIGMASEAKLPVPEFNNTYSRIFNSDGWHLLFYAVPIIFLLMFFGLRQYFGIRKLPAYYSMLKNRGLLWIRPTVALLVFSFAPAFTYDDPDFFVSYLISIAVLGLFEVICMACAGRAWEMQKSLLRYKFV